MKKVILIFPDVLSMTEFLLLNKVSKGLTNTAEKELRGIVTAKILSIACKEYRAKIKQSIAVKPC